MKILLGFSLALNCFFSLAIYLFFRYTRYKREKQNKKLMYRDTTVESIDNIKMDLDFWGDKI